MCCLQDNSINQRVLLRALNKFGYHRVQVVENGLLAAEAVKARALMAQTQHRFASAASSSSSSSSSSANGSAPMVDDEKATDTSRDSGAASASATAINRPFDLILLDIMVRATLLRDSRLVCHLQMPVMDGLAECREIRSSLPRELQPTVRT